MTIGPIKEIQKAVCGAFGITMGDLHSHRRTKPIAHARIIGMGLVREFTKASYPLIARQFSREDHTTAINAVKRSAVLLERYPEYAEKRAAIVTALTRPSKPCGP